YYEWCKKNNFTSKLPKDREKKDAVEEKYVQKTLEGSLVKVEKKVAYTQRAMNEAIWTFIVDTNQPISIIERSSFKHMINVAASAKDGVILPDRKSTRNRIMKMFYKRMEELKALFAVRLSYC
ncbi:hypothetical protein F5880DRAFT_1494288, partial [Lentinula raphanica]